MISARTGEPKQQDPPLSYAQVEMTLLKTIWGARTTQHLLAFPCEAILHHDPWPSPKVVKDHESRVGITPAGVKALVEANLSEVWGK